MAELGPIASYHDHTRTDAIALLPAKVGRTLDFGGGIGATGAALRTDGRADHVVLFDLVASDALPAIDAAEALDFDDTGAVAAAAARHGPFDTIMALDVLEHLRDPWATSRALAGALADGGRMLISVPNVASVVVLGPLLLRDRFDYVDAGVLDRTHLRWFTRRTIVALARDAGLAVTRVEAAPLTPKYRLLDRATLGLLRRFLAKQWLVLAEKTPPRRAPAPQRHK